MTSGLELVVIVIVYGGRVKEVIAWTGAADEMVKTLQTNPKTATIDMVLLPLFKTASRMH